MQLVNGFECRNCTDIDNAKKHIDPAHPKDGPYGINADQPGGSQYGLAAPRGPSVQFGGALAGQNPAPSGAAQPQGPGSVLNLTA
jgi:hypothetical protein